MDIERLCRRKRNGLLTLRIVNYDPMLLGQMLQLGEVAPTDHGVFEEGGDRARLLPIADPSRYSHISTPTCR
jgi:hypothetical protein